MKKILFLVLFLLTGCSSDGKSTPIRAIPTASASPQPTATALPTPFSSGDTVIWQNLQLKMDQCEVTKDYLTEFDSSRVPPAGDNFLWVYLHLKNVGQKELNVPGSEHFSVLYAGVELKPTYGHRKDHPDYTALEPLIFPAQELDAWLRFDIPTAAELRDLHFVFLPTSAQVGVLPSSPSYPYAENKQTYVWKCEG